MNGKINFACLQPDTQKVLSQIIESSPLLIKYVFVGGSALAVYFCHRQSEDLDFFTYKSDEFNKNEIRNLLKIFTHVEILNESDTQIDLLLDKVKVTFFDAQWSFLEPKVPETFNLSSLESIAAMKVNSLFLRAKYRDYYDLYFLVKKMGLQRVFHAAEKAVPGLTIKLFYTALIYIDDIAEDNISHLAPIEILTKQQIRNFFEEEIHKQG